MIRDARRTRLNLCVLAVTMATTMSLHRIHRVPLRLRGAAAAHGYVSSTDVLCLEEERRAFYVAATRASEAVMFTVAA
jgi:hypothetical protein